MSTNYYWYKAKVCTCCKRIYEPIHIGLRTAGWNFSLHVIPELDINTLKDWERLWNTEGSYILDEYGSTITAKDMLAIVKGTNLHKPTNLRKAPVDRKYCIGHAEGGHYSYCIGDFS